MDIENEVAERRKEIHTDAYPMSIGELTNLYRDKELEIHPEFQREFRWSLYQKSRLIESILLGIPLPSIFVAQRKDGVWDVVDGLQRISTILSFMGELLNEEGVKINPLVLEKTHYLPSLAGISWENGLPDELKRAFKREKIDVKIIKRESDEEAKFELFQRLNTGGSDLSEQEVRNCLLIMLNREAFKWLKKTSEDTSFRTCLDLSDRLLEQKYDMELALRFFIMISYAHPDSVGETDMSPYLTARMKSLVLDEQFNFDENAEIFRKTFNILEKALGDASFKRYSQEKSRHEGQFSVALFECLSTGVAFAVKSKEDENEIIAKAKMISLSLGENDEYVTANARGTRGIHRFPKLVNLGRILFQPS